MYIYIYIYMEIRAVVLWLKQYAISRKVAGSRPDEVNFFNLPNPSCRTSPWGLLSF
jgi:hypothetical protein